MIKRLIGIASLLLATQAFATDRATFDNHTLSIPVIDSKNTLGVYQDVTFEHSKKEGWKLVDFSRGVNIREISNVQLIQTKTFPVQVFLKISGTLVNGCQVLGRIEQKFTERGFEVAAFYENEALNSGPYCTMVVTPFSKTIPLNVYGLSAGSYNYSVNNNFTGHFYLKKDNFFLESAGTID